MDLRQEFVNLSQGLNNNQSQQQPSFQIQGGQK
jgi:hypothetical protein